MRLTLPDKPVKLYEDTLEKLEYFKDRKDVGDKLSKFLEAIEEPLVIALDGSWGCGKTHFLKLWVGSHTESTDAATTVIYFDAFENDYLDDPLISLIDAITDRLKQTGKLEQISKTLKKLAPNLARISLRSLVSVASASIVNNADEMMAPGSHSDIWQSVEERRAAMVQFSCALRNVASPTSEGGEPGRLVLVIDELDRCRPDYALSLLETIKHVFWVDKVHIVLGVNLSELENTVRARYGMAVDATRYLHKFYQAKIPINGDCTYHNVGDELKNYFQYLQTIQDLELGLLERPILELAQIAFRSNNLSLRDLQRISTRAAIVENVHGNPGPIPNITAILIFLDTLRPELLTKILNLRKHDNDLALEIGKVLALRSRGSTPSTPSDFINAVNFICLLKNETLDRIYQDVSVSELVEQYIWDIKLM